MFPVVTPDDDSLVTGNVAYGALSSGRLPVTASGNTTHGVVRQAELLPVLENPVAAAQRENEGDSYENVENIYEPIPDSN